MLAAQKAKAQRREGEEAVIFFFSLLKLKLPEKRKCCPCNFGRDFQLLFPLSEGHLLLGKKRGEEQWPRNLACARDQRKRRRKMGRGRITRGEKKNIKSDSADDGADRSKREKKKCGKKYPNCWEMNRKGQCRKGKEHKRRHKKNYSC